MFTDEVDGPTAQIAMKKSRDFGHKNVMKMKTSDGDVEYNEIEVNFFQLCGRNWRQFTSVLPGLQLLLTIGMHDVFTIYECDQFRVWPKLLNANDSFLNSVVTASLPHTNFENRNHEGALSRNKRSPFYVPLIPADYEQAEYVQPDYVQPDYAPPEYAPPEYVQPDYDYIGGNNKAYSIADSFRDHNNENDNSTTTSSNTLTLSTPTSTSGSYTTNTTINTVQATNSNQTTETSTGTTSTVAEHVHRLADAEIDYIVESVGPAISTVAYPSSKYDRDDSIFNVTISYEDRFLSSNNISSTTQAHHDPSTSGNLHPKPLHKFTEADFKSMIFIMMWFCGAIIGNIYGALLVRNSKKRTIYVSVFRVFVICYYYSFSRLLIQFFQYIDALLQISAGILFFLMRDAKMNDELPFIRASYKKLMLSPLVLGIAARFVSGVACGMAHLTVTVHASDIASKRMRPIISYAIVMVMASSKLFYTIVVRNWYLPHAVENYTFGIDLIAVGIVIVVLNSLLTNECVPYYLMRAKVTEAQKKFALLHSEREPSAGTLRTFADMRTMVSEDIENGKNIFVGGNFKPLCTVLSARLLHLLLTSVPWMMYTLSWAKVTSMPIHTYDDQFLVELCGIRIIVGTILLAIASCLGRQKFLYVLAILIACGLVSFHGILSNVATYSVVVLMTYTLPTTFVCLSFGLDFYQQEQSVEAFTTAKKAWSLAMIGIFEHFTHVALIAASLTLDRETFTFIGVGIVVLSCILLAIVPDTRKSSLRETRNKYNERMVGPTVTITSNTVWSFEAM